MSKVIRREVVGSSNSFARFFRQLGDSFKGIFVGILLIIISFVIIGFSANQTEHSKIIAALPLLIPEEAVNIDGMVKIQGKPNYSHTITAPHTDVDVLYYSYTKEEYAVREVEKTRTITEDGQEIRETYIDYEPDWERVESSSGWSDFSLGPIQINPGSAKKRLNSEVLYEKTEDVYYDTYLDEEDLVDVPQKVRETVAGVRTGGDIIVVGLNEGGHISMGTEGSFFITNKSHAEFIADQETAEKRMFWGMIIGAWFLMSLGFTMLFGPVTHLLNAIPGLGSLTRGLLFLVFGILSAVIVFFAYLGIKFWWILILLICAIAGYFIYRELYKERKQQT